MIDWIKKEIKLNFKIGFTNLKTNFIVTPIFLLTFLISYFLFKSGIIHDGFWIILNPLLVALFASLVLLLPKRNDPNYQIYYLFHLSKISKVVIFVGIILAFALFIFAQCQAYGLEVGKVCLQKIF